MRKSLSLAALIAVAFLALVACTPTQPGDITINNNNTNTNTLTTSGNVPVAGAGFNGDALANPTVEYTRQAIRNAMDHDAAASEVINEYAMLSLLASVTHGISGKLKVLDFGGGVGINYVHLRSALPDTSALEYHVVELEWACRAGPQLFPDDGHIHFHRTLPETMPNLSVLYTSGVLAYVEDYAGLLKELCAYRAEYFLFSNVPTGAFATFASAQKNVPGMLIPCWFFNRDEIESIMGQHGYELVCSGAVDPVYNQNNFPAERRLKQGRASQMLFSCANPVT